MSSDRLCPKCNGRIMTQSEWEQLELMIESDSALSGGEFFSRDRYYEGVCLCCEDDSLRDAPAATHDQTYID